ncbi:DUF2244 domain-containing protein [Reyranella sp.]|uniref:DUF2244 domain-containing protein n=1 Tax=Reyranella sp. TaxID=1929291 RepID=UPI003BA8B44F
MTQAPLPAVHFATSLVPHRSLSPTGFRWLIGVAIAANLAIGLPLMVMGAWPVMGFMGLDILLLWWLFKRSYLDARRSETLLLTDQDLIIDRVAPDGEREQIRLDAYWLRVEWQEKDERLVVHARGNRAVLGRFLSPGERRELADQLKAALAAMRAPRYRHAWDRDPDL